MFGLLHTIVTADSLCYSGYHLESLNRDFHVCGFILPERYFLCNQGY